MSDLANNIATVCRLLEMYNVATDISSSDIKNFKMHKSKLYGMSEIYSFSYKDKQYYVTNDHSLMDDPKFIRDVLGEVDPDLKGEPLKNPIPQSDGAEYASGLDGIEYYLWEAPFK